MNVINLSPAFYTVTPPVVWVCPRCGDARFCVSPSADPRPSLLWLVMALVLAVGGLTAAGLATAVGLLALATSLLWLALPPAVTGLGLTAGMFVTEVILCGAGC